ncbi:PDZ domain-containing protein [Patescibacteria group bacterium]|nr:PDZ domain-containing protein [Patescibacteria group bacterium]
MRAKRILTALFVLLLLIPVSCVSVGKNIYQENFRAIANIIDEKYYKPIDFQKCAGEKTVHAIAQSKNEEVFAKHLKEAMKRCLDPHSQYILSRDVERDNQDLKGSFGGAGLELFQDEKTGEVMILGIIPGGPADGSGIAEGDIIVQVGEHKLVKETKVDDVVKWIRGPSGTEVKIYVCRNGTDLKDPFLFTRSKVVVETVVDYATPSSAIGYVRISQFTEGTSVKLFQKMKNLEAQGKNAMILDLRNDPGGFLSEAVCTVALFAPGKTYNAVTNYLRNQKSHETAGDCKSLPQGFFEVPRRVMPMVVLVNEQSASAAEIVAANLQELGFTVVGGKHTYKKGTVQMVVPWWYGVSLGGLRLTIAEYRIGKHDRVVDGIGVRSDVEVVNPEKKDAERGHPPFRSRRKPDFAGDLQLQKAFEILQKQIMK